MRKKNEKEPEDLTDEVLDEEDNDSIEQKMVEALREQKESPEMLKQIKNMTDMMRRSFKKGEWDPKFARQLEVTASTLLIWRRIRAVAMNDKTMMLLPEISREGNLRLRQNGIFLLYLQYANALNHQLRALGMNRDAKLTVDEVKKDLDDDPLAALIRSAANDDDIIEPNKNKKNEN